MRLTEQEKLRRAKRKAQADRAHVMSVARRYGVSPETYAAMQEAQDGRCAICLKEPASRRLSLDHDHRTNAPRAFLCTRCNEAIGRFEWDVHVATNAANYLLAIAEDHERTDRDAPAPA